MIQILVLQRGWVVVGRVTETHKEIVITAGGVVRRWGTTKGLPELAANGPTDETVLDLGGVMRVHPLTVVLRLDCNVDKWGELCKE